MNEALGVQGLQEKYAALLKQFREGVKPLQTNKDLRLIKDNFYIIKKPVKNRAFSAVVRELDNKVKILGLVPRSNAKLFNIFLIQLKKIIIKIVYGI